MGFLYEKESYEIIGIMHNVYNELGHGLRESVYKKDIIKESQDKNVLCNSEINLPIKYKTFEIAKGRLDLLFYDKIVVELKVANSFHINYFKQLNEYLRLTDCKLGLLILFSLDGIKVRRVLNIK